MNLKKYKYKTEMHAHSMPASACGDIPPEEVVRIYSELGYHSIVLSNHFHSQSRFYGDKEKMVRTYLLDYRTACEYGQKYGINVILGCEIRFTENINDYLLFGIDEDFLFDAYDYIEGGLKEFSDWFRDEKRTIIQAHPFRKGMEDTPPELIDGIETFNVHPNHNSRVAVAAKYAKKNDFIVTCGTDYHHLGHHGLSAILTKKPVENSFELSKVLKSRDYLFEVGGHIILPYGI